MPPALKREHIYDPEHPSRPAYFPDITLGNWLTILAMIVTATGVYAANETRVAKIETTQEERDTRVSEQIDELKAANEKLDRKIERLDDKLDEVKTLIMQMGPKRRTP